MAIITIQCRLQAEEETLQYLWRLMREQNTLLINQVLEHIRTHPEIDLWLARGYISAETVKNIVKSPDMGDVESTFHERSSLFLFVASTLLIWEITPIKSFKPISFVTLML